MSILNVIIALHSPQYDNSRPILFRATSTSPVRAFRNTKLVPHPHANVLSSDAFARGLIRSGTDFSVYAGPGPRGGMAGLDLAFYKGRSRYHTKYDAVPYTLGGKKSLWSMMEVAKGVGIGLLNKENLDDKKTKDAPVYFDGEVVRFVHNTGIYASCSVQIFRYRVLAWEIVDIQYRYTRRWSHFSTFTLRL